MFACEVCFERLTAEGQKRPLALPCMHSFCSECLCRLQTLKCPTCRKDFPSFATLLPNYALISQLEIYFGSERDVSDLSTQKLEEMLQSRKLEAEHRKQIRVSRRLEDFMRGGLPAAVTYVTQRRLLEQTQTSLEARIGAAAEAIRQEEQPALAALGVTVRKSLFTLVWHRERAASEKACSWLLGFWACRASSSDYEMPIGKKYFAAKCLQEYSQTTVDYVSEKFRFIRTFQADADDNCLYRAAYVGVIDSLLASIYCQELLDPDEEVWDEAVEAAARARLSAFFALLASSAAIQRFPAMKAKLTAIEADLQTKCTVLIKGNSISLRPSTFLYTMVKADFAVDGVLDLAMRWLALEKAENENEMDFQDIFGAGGADADSEEDDLLLLDAAVARAISRLVIPAANVKGDGLALDVVLWRFNGVDENSTDGLPLLRLPAASAATGVLPGNQERSSVTVHLLLRGVTYCLMYPSAS